MKFSGYGEPVLIDSAPRARCSFRASAFLPHSADKRPVASCAGKGRRLYLCQGCLESLRAERWAARFGMGDMGQGAVSALRRVLFTQGGFQPSTTINRCSASIWYALRNLERRGLVRKHERRDAAGAIRVLFAARDACPDCLWREGHAEGCGLCFGPEFAERR